MKSFPFYKSLFLFYFLAYNCTFQCRFHLSSKSFLPGAHFTFFSYKKKLVIRRKKCRRSPFTQKRAIFAYPKPSPIVSYDVSEPRIQFLLRQKKKKKKKKRTRRGSNFRATSERSMQSLFCLFDLFREVFFRHQLFFPHQ